MNLLTGIARRSAGLDRHGPSGLGMLTVVVVTIALGVGASVGARSTSHQTDGAIAAGVAQVDYEEASQAPAPWLEPARPLPSQWLVRSTDSQDGQWLEAAGGSRDEDARWLVPAGRPPDQDIPKRSPKYFPAAFSDWLRSD